MWSVSKVANLRWIISMSISASESGTLVTNFAHLEWTYMALPLHGLSSLAKNHEYALIAGWNGQLSSFTVHTSTSFLLNACFNAESLFFKLLALKAVSTKAALF